MVNVVYVFGSIDRLILLYVVLCLVWSWLEDHDRLSIHLSFNLTVTLCFRDRSIWRILCQRLQESFQDQSKSCIQLS